MSAAFNYRPKFVDIRVRPPKPEEAEAEAADVHALKPGQKPCDWPGCRRAADARAPKSRERLNEHYWFCQPHAAEYNKSWDFFAGMDEEDVRAAQAARATGERPTWSFKASRQSREAASFAARGGRGQAGDAFGLFGARPPRARAEPSSPGRRLGRLEARALIDLDLEPEADGPAIRARYLELVKQCHPDANGGDRSAEHKLQRVLKAYKVLRQAQRV